MKQTLRKGAGARQAKPVPAAPSLHRAIGWGHAFWVASGVPALVLFSIGAVAATVGAPSWLVWGASIAIGCFQAFTYAEVAGLFPEKSGGVSIGGALAWARYFRPLAPVSVWCHWFAWSPVLAIGSGLGAGYVLSLLAAPDSPLNTWQWTLADLGFLKAGLTLRINATFFVGAALLLGAFGIQHRGILGAAKVQIALGLAALLPLLAIGLVPLFNGQLRGENLWPFAPLAFDGARNPVAGAWDLHGWTLLMAGLFIAGWSTYGFETAVCYTREFKDPARDTPRAIGYSGLLCLAAFTLVPLAFQGSLSLKGLLDPGIYSGAGVAAAMAGMIGGGKAVGMVLVVLFILALLLSIVTGMAGSSRTLYQGSADGWLPKFLSQVNRHGSPENAMWADLILNLGLLLMSDYVFILAISNVTYMIFTFLNLNAAWIHRLDRPSSPRPFRSPAWLLGAGVLCAFLNLAFLGMGANVWGAGTLLSGLVFAGLSIPLYYYRHTVTDKGTFPAGMEAAMGLRSKGRAKGLVWLTLGLAVAVVAGGRILSRP